MDNLKEEFSNLNDRIKKLAIEKSNLQLITHLMNKMSTVTGLENTIENLLQTILDNIGGTNLIIYYTVENEIFYADVFGKKMKVKKIEDKYVKKVFKSKVFIKYKSDFSDTKMLTEEFTKSSSYVFPLQVGDYFIGVLKIEDIVITNEFALHLPTFFTYAAHILKNEILGYTNLKTAFDKLSEENFLRKKAQEELKIINNELEIRVAERTNDLNNANTLLKEDLVIRKQTEELLESQNSLLTAIINNSSDLNIFSLDKNYCYINFNEKHRKEMKKIWSVDINIGMNLLDCMNIPELRKLAKQSIDRALLGEAFSEIQHQTGTKIYYEFIWSPIKKNKKIIGVTVFVHDISERKLAEEQILKLNRIHTILSNTNQTIVRSNDSKLLLNEVCRIAVEDGKFRMVWIGMVNPQTYKIDVLAASESTKDYLNKINLDLKDEKFKKGPTGRAIKSGHHYISNDISNDKNMLPWVKEAQRKGYKSLASFPIKVSKTKKGIINLYSDEINFFDKDNIKLLDEIAMDISFAFESMENESERKNAEKALVENEKKYRELFEGAPDAIFLADIETGKIIDANPSACKLLKKSLNEIVGINQTELHPPDVNKESKHFFEEHVRANLEGLNIEPFEHYVFTSEDKYVPVEILAKKINFEGRQVLQGIFRDITERKKSEAVLRAKEKDLKEAQRIGRLGSWEWNAITDTITWSEEYYHILGFDPTQKPPGYAEHLKVYTQESINRLDAAVKKNLETGKPYELDLEFAENKANCRWITARSETIKDEKGKIIGLRGTAQDITERKLVEDALFFVSQRGWQISKENFFDALAQFLGEKLEMDYVLIDKIDENPDMAETVSLYAKGTITPNLRYTLKGTPCENVMGRRLCVYPHGIQQLFPEDTLLAELGAESYIGIPLWESTGKPIGLIAVMSNKTLPDDAPVTHLLQLVATRAAAELERKQAEEALFKQQQVFRTLVENSPDIIARYDINCKRIYVNPRYLKEVQISQQELVTTSPIQLSPLPPESAEILQNMLRKVLDSGVAEGVDIIWPKSDNINHWYNVYASPEFDRNGKVESVMTISREITERKNAEDELRKLSVAVEQSPASIIITNLDANIVYVNPKVSELTGYKIEELIGENPRILQSGLIPKEVYKELWKTIVSGNIWHGEFQNKKKNGELYWEYASLSPIIDNKGKITHYLAVKEDITERKKMINELIIAKDKAEEMSRLKTNFLANMSHEIRTPLNGILGFSQLLKDELNDSKLINYADIIERSGNRLLETLDLILGFSKLEAEKENIQFSNVNINSVIDEVLKSFDAMAKKRNLYLKSDFSKESVITKIDERFLRQIINNLVNNAIKYTNTGGIIVDLSKEEKGVIIKVKDTGIGIAADKFNVIFEEFRQESEGYGRSFEGTGLGLAITKRFVELMKGTIKVESEVGVGSTFIVRFPYEKISQNIYSKIKKVETKKQSMIKSSFKKGTVSILFVENDEANRLFTEAILKEEYNVDSTTEGIEAINKAKEKVYDIILMDINLGRGMDGMEAVRKIRKLPGYEKTPIIALTAFVLTGDKEEFLSGGCSHYLGKPFSRNQILELINDIVKSL